MRKRTFENAIEFFCVLTISCLAQDLIFRVFCVPKETPLKKTNLSFASSYQLEIDSELGIGLGSMSPVSTEMPSFPDLCRRCACGSISLSSYVPVHIHMHVYSCIGAHTQRHTHTFVYILIDLIKEFKLFDQIIQLTILKPMFKALILLPGTFVSNKLPLKLCAMGSTVYSKVNKTSIRLLTFDRQFCYNILFCDLTLFFDHILVSDNSSTMQTFEKTFNRHYK